MTDSAQSDKPEKSRFRTCITHGAKVQASLEIQCTKARTT